MKREKINSQKSQKQNRKPEDNQVSLAINGKTIKVPRGTTILEAVRRYDLDDIPTLCHDDRIEPYGSCFLCVVEVKGSDRLAPSCCTPVARNMEVETSNTRIQEARKTALELLLSTHYADCVAPCNNKCPAGVDAQGYIALMSRGQFDEALALIKQRNPLPLSIGRICVRDCETACRRQLVDEPVGINHLKRYAADLDALNKSQWKPAIKPSNGKRVAVVGGGPAGLSCAYYLTLEGFNVTIFEKQPRLGGMLMYGIPEYRLPKEILDKETGWLTGLGIEVQTNTAMGRDFDIQSLQDRGFHSVFLAVGAHKAADMRLEHENDTEGVLGGIEFLRNFADGPIWLNGAVVIVGGGNTAIDAARTALRCGAEKVDIVYRRGVNEMPAHDEEVHAAEAEGIRINFLTNPTTIVRDKKKRLRGIQCTRMELEDAKPGERPRPVPVKGSEFFISCDFLISAIGQAVDTSFNKTGGTAVALERWGAVISDPATLETSVKGVFAGGDAVTGPDTAINAIAQGKQAAHSIATYLTRSKAEAPRAPFLSFKHRWGEISQNEMAHIPKAARNKMPELPANKRTGTFCEVELGYRGPQAESETARCLECGCSDYYDCELRKYADRFNVDITPYMGGIRKYPVDDRHPFIKLDPNKCINCGRCVRTCAEILDVSALGFVHRGFNAVVKPAMEKPLLHTNCIGCGNCIDTCPTGALSEKFPFKVMGTLPKTNHRTICNYCSIGCTINIKRISDSLLYVSNTPDSISGSINNGYLCSRGRFGHRYLSGAVDRLTQPLITGNGQTRQTGWEEALDTITGRLQDIIAKHGPGAVAISASPKMSNEELYLVQKTARAALKTNNIFSFSRLPEAPGQSAWDEALGFTCSTASLEDIADADVLVLINQNLTPHNLVLELKIKEARKKNNSRLILAKSSESPASRWADLWIDSRKGTNTYLLYGIMREIIKRGLFDTAQAEIPGFRDLAESLQSYSPETVTALTGITMEKYDTFLEMLTPQDRKILFIYDTGGMEQSPGDLEALANFLLLTDRLSGTGNRGGIILNHAHANSAGLLEMGVHPGYLPGFVKPFEGDAVKSISRAWDVNLENIFKPGEKPLTRRLLEGDIKGLLVFGEDPLALEENRKYFNNLEFLAVVDAFPGSTTARADVVIPASTFIEEDGTYISCDRRVQKAPGVIPCPLPLSTPGCIQALAKRFGRTDDYPSVAGITSEIRAVNRLYIPVMEKGGVLENPLDIGGIDKEGRLRYITTTPGLSTAKPDTQPMTFPEIYFRKLQMKLEIRN